MKILYHNLYEGCYEPDRFEKMIAFVKQQQPDILGLSELNNWNDNDFEKLKEFQRKTGYAESVFCEVKPGYHLGLFSKNKFTNTQAVTEGFWHGIAIAEIDDLVVVVLHLCPENEETRVREVREILKCVDTAKKVVLMGDFNSLSPHDTYDEQKLRAEMKSINSEKFGKENIRYDVIKKLEEAGFVDSIRACNKSEFTVPTKYNKDQNHFSKMRLDYIFVTQPLVKQLKVAEAIKNAETHQVSDHFPVYIEIK